jgi:hypothetical protein
MFARTYAAYNAYIRAKRRQRALAALAHYKARVTRRWRQGFPLPDPDAERAILRKIYNTLRA